MPTVSYTGPGQVLTPGIQNTGVIGVNGANATQPSWSTIRLFGDFQDYLDPTETPFVSSLKRGKPIDARRVEWTSSFLAPMTSKNGAGAISGAGTAGDIIVITPETGGSLKFMVSEVFDIDSEKFWCTGLNHATNAVSAMRGMAGTTVASHLASAIISLRGPAAMENVNSPRTPIAKGAVEYNVPQLFDYSLQVSEMEDNTPDYEFRKGSKLDAYLAKVMKEAARDFEQTMFIGKRTEEVAMSPDATATPLMMGGLDYFTNKTLNLSNTAISENIMVYALQTLWTDVGSENMAKTLLVNPYGKRAISSLWNTERIATVKDKETTLVWNAVETDFGTIKFVMSRYVPAGTAYLVNLDDITIHPYKNMQWREVALPMSGPMKASRFTGAYTAIFRKNAARMKIYGISETDADYPNM